MNAVDNVRLVLEVGGERPHRAVGKAMDALAMVGLAHKVDAYPLELSSGEQQRVAIARAVVGDAAAILADEPTAALDSENGHSIMSVLAEVAKGPGRGVLVVTHDARTLPFAKRIVRIDDGRIVGEEQGVPASPTRTNEVIANSMTTLRGQRTFWTVLGLFGVAAVVAAATAWPIGVEETASDKTRGNGAGWRAVAPGVAEPGLGRNQDLAAGCRPYQRSPGCRQ